MSASEGKGGDRPTSASTESKSANAESKPNEAKRDEALWLGFDADALDPDDMSHASMWMVCVVRLCVGVSCVGLLAGLVIIMVGDANTNNFKLRHLGEGLMGLFALFFCLFFCGLMAKSPAELRTAGGKSRKSEFEFIRLNNKFSSYKKDLDECMRHSERSFPKTARAMMKAKEAEASKKKKESDVEKKKEQHLLEQIKTSFDQGLGTEEVAALVRPVVFVVEFEGDVAASGVHMLRKIVTIIKEVADPRADEVVLKLTSPGGYVTGYGLASLQLMRLRERGLNLTVCVDTIAASGG